MADLECPICNKERKIRMRESKRKWNITELAKVVAMNERGKEEVNITQIREILRVINDAFDGEFYKWIRRQS